MYGVIAVSFNFVIVGAMMKPVSESASATMTWFGGNCGVPIAWRKNENTIMMRANDVTEMTIDDAKESSVMSKNNFTAEEPPPRRS